MPRINMTGKYVCGMWPSEFKPQYSYTLIISKLVDGIVNAISIYPFVLRVMSCLGGVL